MFEGAQANPRSPVNTAWAAPLTSGFDTCLGSASGGAQTVGFGVSFGTTKVDKNCVRLKNASALNSLGHREAAVALMCQNADVRKAMETAGTPCK